MSNPPATWKTESSPGKQVIAVEPNLKRIVVTRLGRLRTSSRGIYFNEIADVCVGESGDQEGGASASWRACEQRANISIETA